MRLTAIYPTFLLALAYIPTVASSCRNLDDCIESGKTLMGKIKDATADKAGLPDKYVGKYPALETRETVANTFKDIFDIMEGLPLKMPVTLRSVTIVNKKMGDVAYQNAYGKGIIAAIANYRSYDPVPPNDQVHWDVIAFEQYRTAGYIPADLTYVLQHTVDNPETQRTLRELYDIVKEPTSKWIKWDPNGHGADNSNGFYALLGTPLGQGPGNMLVDYAGTMGRRLVAAIYTRRWDSKWMMVVEFVQTKQNLKETADFIPFLSSLFDSQSYPVVRYIAGLL